MIDLLKNEVFRPVVSLLVPGVISILPYFAWWFLAYPPLAKAASANSGASLLVAGILALGAGLLLEDVGSSLELLLDKREEKKTPNFNTVWNAYLALRIQDEFVAQRYLRTVLVRFKFELSMVFAPLIGLGGLLGCHFVTCTLPTTAVWTSIILTILVSIYCLREASCSVAVLHTVRATLVDATKTSEPSTP